MAIEFIGLYLVAKMLWHANPLNNPANPASVLNWYSVRSLEDMRQGREAVEGAVGTDEVEVVPWAAIAQYLVPGLWAIGGLLMKKLAGN